MFLVPLYFLLLQLPHLSCTNRRYSNCCWHLLQCRSSWISNGHCPGKLRSYRYMYIICNLIIMLYNCTCIDNAMSSNTCSCINHAFAIITVPSPMLTPSSEITAVGWIAVYHETFFSFFTSFSRTAAFPIAITKQASEYFWYWSVVPRTGNPAKLSASSVLSSRNPTILSFIF